MNDFNKLLLSTYFFLSFYLKHIYNKNLKITIFILILDMQLNFEKYQFHYKN